MSFTEISQEFQKALESMLDETIENFVPGNNFQVSQHLPASSFDSDGPIIGHI